jgi:hypothetical protein
VPCTGSDWGSHAGDEREREHAAELSVREEALDVVHGRLEQLAEEGRVSPEVLAILRARHQDRLGRLPISASDGFETAVAIAEVKKIVFRSASRPNQISFSHDQDPNRKLGWPKCRDQHGFLNDVVGCDTWTEGSP